jgi:nicotinamide riboside kinase
MKIALLGAECTGKTRLSLEMARQLEAQGLTVGVVPEVLREWCQREGRTPSREDQYSIAQEQARRVVSMGACDIVISDTAPVMTAVYSEKLFNDGSILNFGLQHHAVYDLTLVMGLDLPWVADGHQRDGPHSQEPIDTLLRATLASAAITYTTVYGKQASRRESALAALSKLMQKVPTNSLPRVHNGPTTATGWVGHCDKCDDAYCEHRLFQKLLTQPSLE